MKPAYDVMCRAAVTVYRRERDGAVRRWVVRGSLQGLARWRQQAEGPRGEESFLLVLPAAAGLCLDGGPRCGDRVHIGAGPVVLPGEWERFVPAVLPGELFCVGSVAPVRGPDGELWHWELEETK